MIDIKDRIIQYPSRYQLVEVATGIYDLVQVTGTVTETGTIVNKTLFDDLYSEIRTSNGFSIYQTLVTNANIAGIEASLGKGLPSSQVHGVGMALALYAMKINASSDITLFENLSSCRNVSEINANPSALQEILNNDLLYLYMMGIPYLYNSISFSLILPNITLVDGLTFDASLGSYAFTETHASVSYLASYTTTNGRIELSASTCNNHTYNPCNTGKIEWANAINLKGYKKLVFTGNLYFQGDSAGFGNYSYAHLNIGTDDKPVYQLLQYNTYTTFTVPLTVSNISGKLALQVITASKSSGALLTCYIKPTKIELLNTL